MLSINNHKCYFVVDVRLKEALVMHTGFALASCQTSHLVEIMRCSKEHRSLLCLISNLNTEKRCYNQQLRSVNTQVRIGQSVTFGGHIASMLGVWPDN